jgi:hypothetical protein
MLAFCQRNAVAVQPWCSLQRHRCRQRHMRWRASGSGTPAFHEPEGDGLSGSVLAWRSRRLDLKFRELGTNSGFVLCGRGEYPSGGGRGSSEGAHHAGGGA